MVKLINNKIVYCGKVNQLMNFLSSLCDTDCTIQSFLNYHLNMNSQS